MIALWDLPGARIFVPPCKKGQRYVRLRSLLLRSGEWLSKLWIKQRQQQQQFSTTTTKQLDMQVLFSSFYSNSPANVGFIYTLGEKGGNIVLFWVAVRVVKCLHIFMNHFVSEEG